MAVSDIVFTPTIKEIQTRRGSRRAWQKREDNGSVNTAITPELAQFAAQQTSLFIATANLEGQPYIQHRGGPAGFLRVLDETTFAFADFAGNRQYVTAGNLQDNPKAQLFLIDYTTRRRVKVWGTARVLEGDAATFADLAPVGYKAVVERAVFFSVVFWEGNCHQHIPQRFDAPDIARVLAERDRRIAELEAELLRLRQDAHA